MDKNIHESSYVDDGAIIGEGTKIWHFSHLMPGCEIGKKCIIGQNCFIGSNVKIGNGVKIQNNVSIYDQIIIEDYVFLGPSVVFTNVINPRAFIERKSEYLETVIKKGASLGANSTIVCGNTIGKYSLIGAGCVVTKNIKDFALVVGVPCKQIGWVDRFGNNLNLPFKSDEILSINVGNYTYTLKGDSLYECKN